MISAKKTSMQLLISSLICILIWMYWSKEMNWRLNVSEHRFSEVSEQKFETKQAKRSHRWLLTSSLLRTLNWMHEIKETNWWQTSLHIVRVCVYEIILWTWMSVCNVDMLLTSLRLRTLTWSYRSRKMNWQLKNLEHRISDVSKQKSAIYVKKTKRTCIASMCSSSISIQLRV